MSTSLAFVFPGQGSQSLGMLAELGAAHPLVIDTFKEASDALGYDLWAVTQNMPGIMKANLDFFRRLNRFFIPCRSKQLQRRLRLGDGIERRLHPTF